MNQSEIKEKLKNNPEYIQNESIINSIKDALSNHADVPIKLIDWLIDAVKANTELEMNLKNK